MISSKPSIARGVRVTPTTCISNAFKSFAVAIPMTPTPTITAVLPQNKLQRRRSQRCAFCASARRRAVNAAPAGEQRFPLERRAAQDVVDAGRQALHPLQPRRALIEFVFQLDA